MEDPASFRPISLIDTTAILFEKLVLYRLESELADRSGLSIKQFGFRRGMGTIDVINRVLGIHKEDQHQGPRKRMRALISLDV